MIVFFDLETTGVDTLNDRIVTLCAMKIDKDGNQEVKNIIVDPQIEIPQGATDVHGISNEDVKDKPIFKSYAKGIHSFIEGCYLGGHNIVNYDIPLLYEEFKRSGIEWDWKSHKTLDTQQFEWIVNKRSLEACFERYTGKTMTNAHNAEADVIASFDVYKCQAKKHGIKSPKEFFNFVQLENPTRVDVHGKIIEDQDGAKFGFGKYKGQNIKVLAKDVGYYNWIIKTFPHLQEDLGRLLNS